MIARLFKQIDRKYRQLYSDPIVASSLFRSLSEFEQQLIFRMITCGGQMKRKQFEKVVNPHFQQSVKSLNTALHNFQTLQLFEYINQQKTFKINASFLQSIEKYVANLPVIKSVNIMQDEDQEDELNFKQPLLQILFDKNLQTIIGNSDLQYISLQYPVSGRSLQKNNFSFLKASNATRVGILIKGLLKSKNSISALRDILYFSTLEPRKRYQIQRFNRQIIKDLQRMKLLKVYKERYIIINPALHNFAFEQSSVQEETQNLNIRVIIETNYKVYVILKKHSPKNNAIIKSIMRDLLQLQHEEYDFEGMVVGAITLEKMKAVFDAKISSESYIEFFQQYMDEEVSNNKDLGKWKKLKFLGAQGTNNQGKIPCSVKQQLFLWQSEYNQGNMLVDDVVSEEDN